MTTETARDAQWLGEDGRVHMQREYVVHPSRVVYAQPERREYLAREEAAYQSGQEHAERRVETRRYPTVLEALGAMLLAILIALLIIAFARWVERGGLEDLVRFESGDSMRTETVVDPPRRRSVDRNPAILQETDIEITSTPCTMSWGAEGVVIKIKSNRKLRCARRVANGFDVALD